LRKRSLGGPKVSRLALPCLCLILSCLALPHLVLSYIIFLLPYLVVSCVALSCLCLCLCIVVFVSSCLLETLCSPASPIFVISFLSGSDPHPLLPCLLLYFESDPNEPNPNPNPNPNPAHLQTLSSMAWSLNLQMGQSDVMRLKVISNEISFLVLCQLQSCVLVLCDLTSSEPAASA
jgi:hypothetical protein